MRQRSRDGLYPPIEPYRKGFLRVDGVHELYYEECGSRKGYPILFVHGGPGAGCDADDRQFFDPKKWRIVLFDQRGSGRSKPFATIHENTPQHLVKDIRVLLDKLRIKKCVLFGGSWGSTLSLLYAIAHPETVYAMVLRGIFLAESAELNDYLRGVPNSRFPEVCERFLAQVPPESQKNPAEYYYHMMLYWRPEQQKHFAYEWTHYELARLYLRPKSGRALDKVIRSFPYESLAVLEAYYIRSNCFIEEGYIIKNADRLPDVPTSIIHGRYDDVCPVENALRLSRALPHAKLHVVVAGHASVDCEIRSKLVSETNRIFSEIKK